MINSGAINSHAINAATAGGIVAAEDSAYSRYTCVLTGSPDLTLPISAFSARYRTAQSSYLSVTVPDAASYADEIDARSSGQLVITRTIYDVSGGEISSAELIRVDLETIRIDSGARSSSASLTGHRTTANATPQTVALTGASYRNVTDGLRRYRCKPNNSLRPGDTVQINDEEFAISYISYSVSTNRELMEILESG